MPTDVFGVYAHMDALCCKAFYNKFFAPYNLFCVGVSVDVIDLTCSHLIYADNSIEDAYNYIVLSISQEAHEDEC